MSHWWKALKIYFYINHFGATYVWPLMPNWLSPKQSANWLACFTDCTALTILIMHLRQRYMHAYKHWASKHYNNNEEKGSIYVYTWWDQSKLNVMIVTKNEPQLQHLLIVTVSDTDHVMSFNESVKWYCMHHHCSTRDDLFFTQVKCTFYIA